MKKLILLLLALCYLQTCQANIYDERSLNFYPIPPQYQWIYDEQEAKSLKFQPKYRHCLPPYGMELYATYDLKTPCFWYYTKCRMLGATQCIEGVYFYYTGYTTPSKVANTFFKDIRVVYYCENDDITKRKFMLVDYMAKDVPNQWDDGMHCEDAYIEYDYTTKQKSQMTEKEKFDRAIAEATYMFHFHKEFFGKEWLCADNPLENIAKFTSANIAKEQF